MLMSLGLFVFDLATAPYEELSRTLEWRYASSARFGARDAYQYTGPGAETVTLSGSIVPEIAGDYASLDTLADMADAADALELVDGLGNVWGSFVIKRLDRRQAHLLDNGVPRKTDFTLDLEKVA